MPSESEGWLGYLDGAMSTDSPQGPFLRSNHEMANEKVKGIGRSKKLKARTDRTPASNQQRIASGNRVVNRGKLIAGNRKTRRSPRQPAPHANAVRIEKKL
jgi:hypothetical protein